MRQYGLGLEKPIYEQVIEFIEANGRIMQSSFSGEGKDGKSKQLTRGQMSKEQKEEVRLCARWRRSDEYKILQEYAGQPIENVPEEYKEKIETLRQYGLGLEKPIYEQVIEFIKKHGRMMKSEFSKDGERLKRKELTEEQKEEANLYARWGKSDEYKILQEYAGQPIENVPEEYREKIATLRQYGIEPKPKRKITSKEIVRATMGSLTDQKMADDVYGKLQEQVEKVKEGGVNIDEQL